MGEICGSEIVLDFLLMQEGDRKRFLYVNVFSGAEGCIGVRRVSNNGEGT